MFAKNSTNSLHTVLDPTYERRTNTENRTGPNLWLLTNNRRDAACVRRCVSRIKSSKIFKFKQLKYYDTNI
jgi:hypothetical protein